MKSPASILKHIFHRKSASESDTQQLLESPIPSPSPSIHQSPNLSPATIPRPMCNSKCKIHNKVKVQRSCFKCRHIQHYIIVRHDIGTQSGLNVGLENVQQCNKKVKGRSFGKCRMIEKLLDFECLQCQ